MRFRSIFAVFAAVSCPLVGCGPSMPPPPLPSAEAPTVGPHGGKAFALPEGSGYAELVNEPAVDARSATTPTALVAYFLTKDAKTPMAPPSDVSFRSDLGANKGQAVALKAAPKADDPAGAARFASDLGPYRLGDLRGELSLSVGGKPAKVPIVDAR